MESKSFNAFEMAQEQFDKVADVLAFEVVLAGEGGEESSGQVDGQAGHFKVKPGHVLLAHIGQPSAEQAMEEQ